MAENLKICITKTHFSLTEFLKIFQKLTSKSLIISPTVNLSRAAGRCSLKNSLTLLKILGNIDKEVKSLSSLKFLLYRK